MLKIPKNPGNKQLRDPEITAPSAVHKTIHRLAFDKSLQPNIITISRNGRIIIANEAACKLLGYSKKELLTKTRTAIFDTGKSSFKQMLKQRIAKGHSTAFVTAIQKNGKLIPCEITSAVFMEEDSIEKAIYTIADMSKNILKQKDIDTKKEKIVADNIILAKSNQKKNDEKKEKIVTDNIIIAQAKSDERLAANNEWIKYIAKASYDVMWDWDITTGKIYVGDSIEEVFGYKTLNNTVNFDDFTSALLTEERMRVEKKLIKTLASGKKIWNDVYMFKRQDGSVASTTSRASIVRDEKGQAIRLIGATQDISRLQDLEKELEKEISMGKEHREKFLQAAKLSFEGIWDWNLLTNEFFLGEGFEKLFGYEINKNKGNIATDWSNYLHPDDKEMVEKGLAEAIESNTSHWELAYRFIRPDGSVAKVFNRASIIRDAGGKACRIIGAIQDISKQKILEEKLKEEIKLKEKQISEAREEARKTERSDIGKELHDNVNQLLGASRLYINMAKKGGDNSDMFLSRSSEYTFTAIEEIRKLTKKLSTDIVKNFGLTETIENVIRDTMEVNPVKISFTMNGFMETSLNDKFKLNVFRIVQEELNNILKHAHSKNVHITIAQDKKLIILTIADDGIGFDTSKKTTGIGIDNIKSRALSYKGSADFVSKPGEGCTLTVIFPVTAMLLNE